MTVEKLAEVIGRAHGASLDAVTRALWAAVSAGECCDEDATRLSEAIQERRTLGRTAQAVAGRGFLPAGTTTPRKHQRPPERCLAIERRRRLAASGPMPPALAARFTTGELAVLRIVADEHQARQVCALCLDAIAARAGVSRTLAKGAIRQACRLGMLEVRERRRTGAKSLPNMVRVFDREWLAWMKRGAAPRHPGVLKAEEAATQLQIRRSGIGGRFMTTTDNKVLTTGTTGPRKSDKKLPEQQSLAHR